MLALLGHAIIYLLLTAAEVIWVGGTAVRVWRRREAGLAKAARTGVHKRTLVVLVAAHVIYEVLRRAGAAKLGQWSINYLQEHGASDP